MYGITAFFSIFAWLVSISCGMLRPQAGFYGLLESFNTWEARGRGRWHCFRYVWLLFICVVSSLDELLGYFF